MQINLQQCSSGASLDQAHVLSCLCKLFVGSRMQELSGNKHLPSTQRRKTEMGKKTSVGKAFLNGDFRKRDRAGPCSAFCIGEGSSCASELCHCPVPQSTGTPHLFGGGARSPQGRSALCWDHGPGMSRTTHLC